MKEILPVAVSLVALAFPVFADEKPLGQLNPAVFGSLVEGFDKLEAAPSKGPYFSYTGSAVDSAWAHARLNQPAHIEWTTVELPAALKGRRVTFAIPCGLGGEGAKILGVPFVVSVNGKPRITIHSAVAGTSYWEHDGTHALFALLKRDNFGDPFGILLLSVPPGAVEAGKPATIRVEGKPGPNQEGSFFMVSQYSLGTVKAVEKIGGVAKLAAFKEGEQQAAGEPPKPAANLTGRRDDSVCLTGNAIGALATRNVKTDARYTYYDGHTDSYYFPHRSPLHEPTPTTNFDENKVADRQAGGWVALAEGKLTDGDLNTKVGYPIYIHTAQGFDIVFDLGAEYFLDEIETHATDPHMRNIEIYLKSDGEPRWTLVQTISDRHRFTRAHYPKLSSPQRLPLGGTSARWVRINACFEASWCGFREVQVWGRTMKAFGVPPSGGSVQIPPKGGTPNATKHPIAQRGGEMAVAKPAEIPLALSPNPVLPAPQEAKWTKGAFRFTPETAIVLMPGANERTKRTAEILAQDLKDEFGLALKVEALQPDEKPPKGSIIVRCTDFSRNPPSDRPEAPTKVVTPNAASREQGYSLTITPDRVEIHGADEEGTFYATQTLLQLLDDDDKGNLGLPACTIRDWPEKTFRSFVAGVPVTDAFLKALARFKITHYIVVGQNFSAVAKHNAAARDRFVSFVPLVGFAALPTCPPAFVEKAPGETYEQLNPGRQNPCPSNPAMWKNYFAQLDEAAKCHGDYINVNMDEMYMPDAGSRWNVCEKCRARNLTGHELMADTIETLHRYIASKGKKTMIIDSPFFIAGISHPEDKTNDWRKAADILSQKGLSKDMMVYIWHGLPLAERLRGLGFRVLLWGGVPGQPIDDVFDGAYLNLGDAQFRYSQLLAYSQTLWSPSRALPASETAVALIENKLPVFNQLWTGQALPSRRPGAQFATIDLKKAANRTFLDEAPGDGKGWADLGPNYDLRALKPGKREFVGVPFEILDDKGGKKPSCVMVHNRAYFNRELPERVEIPVGRKAASIAFLHTMDDRLGQAYWFTKEWVGAYYMIYDDGTFEPSEIKYGINICNFDGLQTWWDSGPRGTSMSRATLAWRGQLGAGNEATLYKAEWVNPYPNKKIAKIIFASPQRPTGANPILIAATAVAPTDADLKNAPKPAYRFGSRRAELLVAQRPAGRKLDLTSGMLDTDSRWVTADGIVLEVTPDIRNLKGMECCLSPWASAAGLLWDDCFSAGPSAYHESVIYAKLPVPRKLSGVHLAGPYRGEAAQASDRGTEIVNLMVSVSADGQAFEDVKTVDIHIADEEGPLWIPLPDKPIQTVRIRQTRNPWDEKNPTMQNSFGLGLLELYEPAD